LKPETSRIDSLDVLRGFAILGILMMNIQSFAMVATAYVNPTLAGPMTGVDFWMWLAGHVLAEYKFISIFAALFGAGIVLMAERAEAAGVDPWRRHRRRMILLGFIGLLHAVFIWYGDILFLYAVAGLIAFAFRHLSNQRLLLWAAGLYMVPVIVGMLITALIQSLPPDEYQEMVNELWAPTAASMQTEIQAYLGTYSEQLSQRVDTLLEGYLIMLIMEEGWRALAFMLCGMVLYRVGLFTGDWPLERYRRWAMAGFAFGVPLILMGAAYNIYHEWEMVYGISTGRLFNGMAAPAVALGWVCTVIYGLKSGWLPRFADRLRAVGKTALTCYLLTSVLCTAVFYGYGLGLFGQLGRPGQWAVMIAVWAILLTLAPLWLRYFSMGPVEWLWRRGVYGVEGKRSKEQGVSNGE